MTAREPSLAEFIVICGGRKLGKTRMHLALLDAVARGQLVLVSEFPKARGAGLHLRMAPDIPAPPAATPFWSADYRNKGGRR